MPDPPADRAAGAVTAVTLKLPPFWPADPQIWFAQVEAHFATRGITVKRTKFDHIIACLSPEYATEVRDLVLNPPGDEPYDKLKKAPTDRTAASEQRSLQQLFSTEDLGDKKPTQLLRRMQLLLGDKAIDKAFMRELFLQRLPSNIRMVLASAHDKTTDLEKLAQLADKVVEVATPAASISSVSASQVAAELERLRTEVSCLKSLVTSLPPTALDRNSRARNRSHSRGRSPTPSASPQDSQHSQEPNPLCWYHARYGKDARKCRSPCSASTGNDPAGR